MLRFWMAVWGVLAWAQTTNVKLEDPAVISKGSTIFSTNCGIGYCHGKEGRAGRGPRLAGRKWEPKQLFQTISEGVNNSLMPAFNKQLPTAEIWSVVAYILSLGSESAPSTVPEQVTPTPAPTRQPVPPGAGDPEAGRLLFFDASNPKRCAVCHRVQDRGADIGPDLTGIATKPAREILRDILEPDARLSVEILTVVSKSGDSVTGVKRQETTELLRVYDTSTMPPVLRTIYKDQISSLVPEKRSPMPADYGQTFTRKQLLDLVSFLKSAPVSPEEF